MNPTEYPVLMSDGCAIKARLEADFSRLFSPTGAIAQPPSPWSGGAGSSNNEDASCTAD